MKITVVCKNNEWQIEKLKEAALKYNTNLEVIDIINHENIPANLGEVILWRSSSLGGGDERFSVMNTLLQKHILINRCLARLPRATEKLFQQEYVQKKTRQIHCIPTYTFNSLQELQEALQKNILRYPFIQKPNKGSKGEGVTLINNEQELKQILLSTRPQVYQNFIKNSGDYRVFILGGKMLGAIKRTAKDGGFLNNISQGGSAVMVTDPKILAVLRRIGTTVASIFELTLCGVDIIYDEISKHYIFLEVNTVPQWKGFQEATHIDVAEEIIRYCNRIVKRKTVSTFELVSEEYLSQLHLLKEKKFHFLSRLFLWSGKTAFQDDIKNVQSEYLGASKEEYKKTLERVFSNIPTHRNMLIAKKERLVYFKKYPHLEPFLNLLFKYLFAKEIYNIDLREHIRELVSDTELIKLKKNIENDTDALKALSTHAINYLYTLEYYLGNETAPVDREKNFQIGMSYPYGSFELQIYFFTHCIIGASRFYSTKIANETVGVYTKMLEHIDMMIQEHFQEISLDNKFEFLVCAKICGYTSRLEAAILSEASRSLAPDGNFLIDTLNTKSRPDERNDFIGAEHRNVLFIMSQSPFHPERKSL